MEREHQHLLCQDYQWDQEQFLFLEHSLLNSNNPVAAVYLDHNQPSSQVCLDSNKINQLSNNQDYLDNNSACPPVAYFQINKERNLTT